MSMSDDVNSLVKTKKIKQGLALLPVKKTIESVKGVNENYDTESTSGLLAPLTLKILTYDDTQDVEVTTPTGTATIKTSETAQIIDANGKIWAIDTIIYPAV